jgi:hypothetical protein
MPPSLTTLQWLASGRLSLFPGGPSGPAGFLLKISTFDYELRLGAIWPSENIRVTSGKVALHVAVMQ